jgi:hypothetical protein
MKSKFNTSTWLYEQANAEPNTPAVDTNIPAESTNAPVDNQNTGKLHAFAITADNINGVNKILTGDSKEWKSEVPLTVMGKDGTIGGPAILNGKPIYLMIRVASKTERASSESQLELSDRIYVLLDTTIKELSSWLKEANNKDERIRVSAKLPSGKEHSVELWQESGVSPESVDNEVDNNVSQVSVDMDAQIQNPGTAAGVTGTVSESVINEVSDSDLSLLTDEQKAVVTNIGTGKIPTEVFKSDKLGSYVIVKGKDAGWQANFYSNNRVFIFSKDGKTIKGSYKNGGKSITLDGQAVISGGSVWTNLAQASTGKAKSKSDKPKVAGPFKNKEEGDAFRTWANSTPELAAKYGPGTTFDLDPPSSKSKWNNSFIKKAYAAAKDEYVKSKEDEQEDERTKNFKYKDKEGKTVYYKLDDKPKSSDDDIDLDSLASNTKSEDKVSTKKTKTHTKAYDGRQEAKYEGIATNFDTWKSITEQDEANELVSDDIDSEADLIKDIEAGRIKKGKVIKQIDSDTLEIESYGKNIKIKISNIIDTEKLKSAAASKKAKEAEETEKKAEEEKAAEIEADKSDVEGAKDDLSDAKDDKKEAKKKFKATKKTKRKKNRTAKQERKTAKIKKKTDAINASESVVYNFDDFMNKVNTLNG